MFFNSKKDFSFTLAFKIFNNHNALGRTLLSLEKSNLLPNLKFLFVDFCSTEAEVKNILFNFIKKYNEKYHILFVKKKSNEILIDNYFHIVSELKNFDSDYYVFFDDNCDFSVEWLYTLKYLISIQLDLNNKIFTLRDVYHYTYQMYPNLVESHDTFNIYRSVKKSGFAISKNQLEKISNANPNNNFYDYLNWNFDSNAKIIGPKNNLINDLY